MAEYTFYPKFQEFVTLYRGVVRVWIGNGIDTGTAGMLYAEYIDGLVQQLGMVSDYEEAKKYFADLGIDLTYEEWVERLIQMPENAHDAHVSANNSETSSQQSEAWAVGQRLGVDVPSTDPTYHNNAKYYSENADTQATNSANSAAAALASEQAAQTAQSAAETAQNLAETAQAASETAQGLSEDAQAAAEAAQLASETAQGRAEDAQAASESAQAAAEAAQTASETAQSLAEDAQTAAETAQSLAETAQGLSEDAQTAAEAAQTAAETAQGHAEDEADDAEAWAVGRINGVEVPSTDPRYHNNSKYYSGLAHDSEVAAKSSEDNAADSESNALTYKNAAEAAQEAAEDAQTASETAQGLAENAQSAAETAQEAAEAAQDAAETAQTAAESAQTAAEAAQTAAETAESGAEGFEDSAEAWAVGQINGSDVSNLDPRYHNNSKYYSEQSAASASASQASSEASEAWATGGSGGTASAYNNAKYYSELASTSEQNAATSELNADVYREDSEAWAVGTRDGQDVSQLDQTYHNNSKYYCEQVFGKFTELDRVLSNVVTKYQNHTDGHNPPVGGVWTNNPNPENGKFVWSQTTFTWDNGDTTVLYNVTYIGVNGAGAVDDVNGLAGHVVLDASNIYYDAQEASPETLRTRLMIISDAQIDDLFAE